jgi:hypothetical protein
VVINEVVKEVRDGLNDGASLADNREFVELYNTGATPVDLSTWSIVVYDLVGQTPSTAYNLSGTIAPGGYFVVGDTGVAPTVFTPPGAPTEMFPDVLATVLELRKSQDPFSGDADIVDAVAYDVWRTGAAVLTGATPGQQAQVGSGFRGELFSLDEAAPNISASWSRYQNGLDTNKNGLDFGMLPPTPGASNTATLPGPRAFTITNVDAPALAVGSDLPEYQASFVLPRVINPTVADANNPRALPGASPQGGNAIVAWDPAYGGNAVYAKELTNSFKLYAYFDTQPMGVGPITVDQEWETTIYGIGATDPFFRNPDPTGGIGQIPAGGAEVATRNASTGVGWVYQRFEDGSAPTTGFTKLMLVDFGDGGDSEGELPGEWDILHTIDMSTVAAGWFELGLTYNATTDQIVGRFNGQDFTFPLSYDLFGTFFVGYREGITGTDTHRARHDPPTYDLFSTTPAGVPGDFNNDSKVDAADYVVWRQNGNTGAGSPLPNDNGLTTQAARFTLWRSAFGNPGAGSGLDAGNVPEPSAIALLALGLMTFVARRGR